jgi:hypothetical protein
MCAIVFAISAAGNNILRSEHQRIGLALDTLTRGLFPFFERELKAAYGSNWEETARSSLRGQIQGAPQINCWDAHAILSVMWEHWNNVFRFRLGMAERSLVIELREYRNRWAHQSTFTEDDSYRVLDSVQRLLRTCGAEHEAEEIEDRKFDVLREKLGRRVNEDMARVRFSRARMADVALYLICCVAINSTMYLMYGRVHLVPVMVIMTFITFVFSYFIFKRLTHSTPVYGVHECQKCSKVIYSEVCPYCDPPMRSSSIIKGSSSLRFPPFRDSMEDIRKPMPPNVQR